MTTSNAPLAIAALAITLGLTVGVASVRSQEGESDTGALTAPVSVTTPDAAPTGASIDGSVAVDAGPGPVPWVPPHVSCPANDVCVREPTSDGCRDACAEHWSSCCEDACDRLAAARHAPSWCWDECETRPGATWCALPSTVSFAGGLGRFGVRAGMAAHLSDYPGGSFPTISGVAGYRFDSGASFIAWAYLAPFGLSSGPGVNAIYTGGAGLELGFEGLIFTPWPAAERMTSNWTVSIAATAGAWLPTQCLDGRCIASLPSASLHIGLIDTSGSPFRNVDSFGGLSLTLSSSFGYDPRTDEWMARFQFAVGYDFTVGL